MHPRPRKGSLRPQSAGRRVQGGRGGVPCPRAPARAWGPWGTSWAGNGGRAYMGVARETEGKPGGTFRNASVVTGRLRGPVGECKSASFSRHDATPWRVARGLDLLACLIQTTLHGPCPAPPPGVPVGGASCTGGAGAHRTPQKQPTILGIRFGRAIDLTPFEGGNAETKFHSWGGRFFKKQCLRVISLRRFLCP